MEKNKKSTVNEKKELKIENDSESKKTFIISGEEIVNIYKNQQANAKKIESLEEKELGKVIKVSKTSGKSNISDKDINPSVKLQKKKSLLEKIFGKVHISFETRVSISVISIVLLVVASCFLILKAVNFGKEEIVVYNEVSMSNYSVCVNNTNYYNSKCLTEGMQYVAEAIDKIKVNFNYDVDFSTKIDYDIKYHVIAKTKIYDINDKSKVLYDNQEILVSKEEISDVGRRIRIDEDVDVKFKDSNSFVNSYKANYNLNTEGSLEIILVVDDATEVRNVSTLTIPLGKQTFGIVKEDISNKNKKVRVDNNTWTNRNILYAVIGTFLIIVALIMLIKLTKFVLLVTTKRSKYQTKLSSILREYDRKIVIARNGFVAASVKPITKVTDFNELLDAANVLNKPVIYSKINEVKSEFIVEDEERIYKYVMKESNFSEQ